MATAMRVLAAAVGCGVAVGGAVGGACADVHTVVTTDAAALTAALHASGLTVRSVSVVKGSPGQIGTYSGFVAGPVTIRDGLVLSSGSVADLSPLDPARDGPLEPAAPPARVNSAMGDFDTGGSPEFDAFGDRGGNIHNFDRSFDVAAVEVEFELSAPSAIAFDFIFGSVEFPVYTNRFTDAFIAFVDGLDPDAQVVFDANGKPVQVGRSFAGLETGADVNTAFASPHGLIHHLTTTTPELSAGVHTLRLEVGDVNDQILDSAVFVTGLRLATGDPGTRPSDDCRGDYNNSGSVTVQDLFDFIAGYFDLENNADMDASGTWTPQDLFDFLSAWFVGCA